jgi:predicted nucleic-acid-binding protein
MIGLDSNVLARYYVADRADAEAERQREAAARLIDSGQPLTVCKTVILELEWVLRGYYGFSPQEAASVLRHLLSLVHVTVEDRSSVEQDSPHRHTPSIPVSPIRSRCRYRSRRSSGL